MAKETYGKDTRLAMAPIKQKKRRYYALVFFLVFVIVGGTAGYVLWNKYDTEKKFTDAMGTVEAGWQLGDYTSLDEAEKIIVDRAGDDNPRVDAVAYAVVLRSWIWLAFTGEELLMSECRKFIAFLKEPLIDPETKETFESPYKDEPMTGVADAVYKAVNDQQDEALPQLAALKVEGLPPGFTEFWTGVAHWRKGEWDTAEKSMRGAVAAADTPNYRFALARVLDIAGKDAEAKAEYQKVTAANPNHRAAEAYLMLLSQPEGADPVEAIDSFVKKYEGQVTTRVGSDLAIARANAQFAAGDAAKAQKTIDKAKVLDSWYKPLSEWAPPVPPAPPEGEEGAAEAEADDKKKK